MSARVVGVVFVDYRPDAVAQEVGIHFYWCFKGDAEPEKFLMLHIRGEIEVDPVVCENVAFHAAVKLRSAFGVEENGIGRDEDIFAVNGEDAVGFEDEQEIIAASVGAVDEKIGIMAVVAACVVYYHTASSCFFIIIAYFWGKFNCLRRAEKCRLLLRFSPPFVGFPFANTRSNSSFL
jgi:hypothetical protein